MKRIALALLLTACGTDPSEGLPTTLTADTKTGEVSLKGEKGDKGDAGTDGLAGRDGKDGAKGDTGAAGKDGVNGTNGKDGAAAEPTNPDVWKDPINGRKWVVIQGRHTFAKAAGLCEGWRYGSPNELSMAVRHGMMKALTLTLPTATAQELAVSNADGANANEQMAVVIVGVETDLAEKWSQSKLSVFRVFCTKD